MSIESIASYDPHAVQRTYDEIIDVRSESEFALDHLPGAINLPVLNDEERARVGTIYVQESKLLAKKLGAGLVSTNIGRHLTTHFLDKPGGYHPLVYCWRGGQRSRSLALVLREVGWRVATLKEGYRTYRNAIVETLYHSEPWFRLLLLSGPTGCGKTRVLQLLEERGVATLDLEGLAHHRGSLFGYDPSCPQPSQKAFETALYAALERVPRQNSGPLPVLVAEAESTKIGQCVTPPLILNAMAASPRVLVTAPQAARARYSAEHYSAIVSDPERVAQLLDRLTYRRGAAVVANWKSLLERGQFVELSNSLIEHHYDPSYARALKKRHPPLATLELPDLEERDLSEAADRVESLLDEAREWSGAAVSDDPDTPH